MYSFQALLLLILLSGFDASQQRRREERGGSIDDETIQSIVYQKAKRLGYGLRIIPKVFYPFFIHF